MEEKEKRFPGLYTTLANLGTFYAHKGEIDKGLEIIKKAVALNPKAHFGREKYQIKALEYSKALKDDPSLSKQKDLLGLSLTEDEPLRFGDYRKSDPAFEKAGLEKDVFVALAGIIRFGSGEKNPHIWMSLGMALAYKGDKNLALRAFRRAEVLGHPAASWAAEAVLQHVGPLSSKDWPTLSKELDAEFEKGQAAVKRAQEKEDALLKAGKKTKAFGY
jgi:tetratricopeptide (TPR) repeat protein